MLASRESGWLGGAPAVIAGIGLAVSVTAAVVAVASLVWATRVDREARMLEANLIAHDLATRIAACADPDRSDLAGRAPRRLPAQSRTVPEAMPGPGGYRSTDADWQDEAFRCARFRPLEALRVQIQWVRVQPRRGYDDAGEVRASVDLDGDGEADRIALTEVACSPRQCTVAPTPGPELKR